MIKRAAAGLLLCLVAVGINAKDSDRDNKRAAESRYEKVKPEKHREQPKKPVYSVPEPTGLALLSVGIGALGLRMMLRRRKRD